MTRHRPAAPRLLPLVAALLLSACAGLGHGPAAAPPTHVAAAPTWVFEKSDLAPDPRFRFGRLPNGMRTIIVPNATPKGTVQVRLDVATGSLDETASERGFAHFVEHMAFNGSTHVPEGEMVRLLERKGLAFGADTNAQTSFEQTTYMLDLPRADDDLVDTALMLMRETASELTFSPEAVARERGVVLSELRDGQGYALDNFQDQLAFFYPKATYPKRLPIGTVQTIDAATAQSLKQFWQAHYVPEKTTLVVIGDVDPDKVTAAIARRFGDWQAAPAPARPGQGKVLPHQRGQTEIWINPALAERLTVARHGPWTDEPDTIAMRRENLLRQIGYGIVNRRFQSLSRRVDAPFRGAGFGTSDVFKIGRTTNLIVDTVDGGWARGLAAAGTVWREALAKGFTQAEVDEQVANLRTGIENAAAGEATRNNATLVSLALSLLHDDMVPTTPSSGLARFNAFAPTITPASVLAALKREAVPLDQPLIRFQGRKTPAGGAKALRHTWQAAMAAPLDEGKAAPADTFGYTDFGTPGTVVADSTDATLGIRRIRFANGVMLNIKRTALEADRIHVRAALDGGEMLETRDNPMAVDLASSLPAGGLGRYSQDQLQTMLAGHAVGTSFGANGDTFGAGGTTTARDLLLQLQLMAAYLTDPGYRPEAEELFHQGMANYFARRDATPGSALSAALGGILSGGDPRFTLQSPQAYQQLGFAQLKPVLKEPLARGALEIALVGDVNEATAIADVARTFGALPPREATFRAWQEARQRRFAAQPGVQVVRHKGPANQAIVRMVWPTTDDRDPVQTLTMDLVEQVAGIEVIDTVREKLGKAYSPSASSDMSQVWTGWGTFTLQASVNVADIAATHAALAQTMADLAAHPIDADVLERARAPMLERLDNALKGNGGWLALAARAQSRPDRIARFQAARARLAALTVADVQAAAKAWLTPDKAVTVLVLPDGVAVPKL
ncbi:MULTISPECIES: insulinase family protein [unclassified Novosphingobium]|uniref:M16 family metallopeptidase n=1 Tax=unclassified Novosphingobium TaxID=2644732 RepID=UPI001469D2DA|nr:MULTISPECIES: insulinase family protein [unclassified Novosphingobium]NMN06064.1 zinc protease [Novosphingobium sp. SG919]NMN88361.1 zinc protease [Novosphingobium sp. SG916]